LSHSRQRKDKICLNCNVEIYGRYCHNCGQENIEPKESVWGLITHFLYDITHFDGKFFSTVKYLVTKPGFLSKEYVKGRRASYLHPIKMYVFTSAFFFIVFFSIFKLKDTDLGISPPALVDSMSQGLSKEEAAMLKTATSRADSALIEKTFKRIKADRRLNKDSLTGGTKSNGAQANGVRYETVAAYDSAQAKLPAAARDGWYKRTKTRKLIHFKNEVGKNPDGFFRSLADKIIHSFPQLLFVSLPLFALLLKLLYFRRKEFYYADHGIFTLHLYIFTFIGLFILMMLTKFNNLVEWRLIRYLEFAISLYVFYYTYKAMRTFYQQGRLKTFFKFLLLHFLSFNMILLLFVLFVILSIYEI
jgi:hypothetical protein